MKVIAYLRVSTDRQAEQGLGLDVQEEQIRKWARSHRHQVVAWLRDEGQSGANGLEDRVGLADALDLLGQGTAQGLVVYCVDRLARDLVLQEQLLADLWRMGAAVFSTRSSEAGYLVPDDPEDPSRRLIRQILGAVADYDRTHIGLRLRRGRQRKAEKGGYAYGSPAYGFCARDRELAPRDDEQEALTLIRDMRRDGASLRTIIQALDREGFKPRRGSTWNPGTLSRIVRRVEARTS